MKKLLLLTVKISLIIQFASTIISSMGFLYKLDAKDSILNEILIIDLIVQLIQGLFYIYIYYSLKTMSNNIITSHRYVDWVITTPIMLLSTILFMEYESNPDKKIVAKNVIIDHKDIIIRLGIYNFMMLLFGFLGETDILSKSISTPIGFIFFGGTFFTLWDNFGYKTKGSRELFYFMFVVWGLYGVAANIPVLEKNISYNILDLISKNFYNMYILYRIILLQ